MSNVHQSANAIALGLRAGQNPTEIAEFLQELDLLAPDLPKPSRGMTAPHGAVWYLDGPIGDIRSTGEDIIVFGHDYRHQSFRLVLTKTEAETSAHALLAAAQHQEGSSE